MFISLTRDTNLRTSRFVLALAVLASCRQAPAPAPVPAPQAAPAAGAARPDSTRPAFPAATPGGGPGGAAGAAAEPNPRPYATVIRGDVKTKTGLFKTHRIGGRLYYE